MEIYVGKYSGFCAGVKHTVDTAYKLLEKEKTIYCLGEIVHNDFVIKSLEDKGLITVENISDIPDNAKVIIRAHGTFPKTYELAKKKNLEIYDLTCGKIKVIHNNIINRKDKFIILIGKKDHPECIGTMGYSKNIYIVEDKEDIKECYEIYKKNKLKDIYIVSQTTFSSNKFDELVNIIKVKFNTNIEIDKSICNATEKRQQEISELSKKVTNMLIIGNNKSSNTKELYNIAINNCPNTFLINNIEDLKLKKGSIGIMAGASTPKYIVDDIITYLKNNYPY